MNRTILAMMLLIAAVGHAADMSPEQALQQATVHEKAGAFSKALDIYASFLELNPGHVQRALARYRMALCYDNLADSKKAVAELKLVIDDDTDKVFKHRTDAFMKLAKLQGELRMHEDGVATLTRLMKEGAGLYEDEAQNLCAGYHAILGKYEEAAVLFSVLRDKRSSPLAKEAAYKLAIVWMKAGETDLAKHAVEQFAALYPTHPRTVELFVKAAKHYFEHEKYRSCVAICNQVLSQYKNRAEAIEAAFIIALCYRQADQFDEAIKTFERVAQMPQAHHNSILAAEALFEAAQIYRKDLNNTDKAMEYYALAAAQAKNPITERQLQILQYSLLHQAEDLFGKKKWGAALDLYVQLRNTDTDLNVLSRILRCRSEMDEYGESALFGETDDEKEFIRQRIAANPGTRLALQAEVFLLDGELEELHTPSGTPPAAELSKLIEQYGALLKKYPEDILHADNMDAYIRMRMGYAYTSFWSFDPAKSPTDRWRAGLELYEDALKAAPEALFRVEMLEGIALLAGRLGEKRKAFDAYKTLFEITGRDPQDGESGYARRKGKKPKRTDYLLGMATIAETVDMIDEAIDTIKRTVATAPVMSDEAREGRFYLAELFFMKRRYSDAASQYKSFVHMYGPARDGNDDVAVSWRKPPRIDATLEQVYEAGIRQAHCWYAQGHTKNMIAAYRWVVHNQDHQNPRLAEALYMTIMHGTPGTKDEKRRTQAEALWKRIINPSLDFDSVAFKASFRKWIRHPTAIPYAKTAILKAGEMYSDLGRHDTAAEIFQQYLQLYSPGLLDPGSRSRYPRDDMYNIASYAAGREYIQAGDYESMAECYRSYVNGLRNVRFRPSILMLLGHYGTEGGFFNDAAEAYATLLDEYGKANPVDKEGKPVPVPDALRLRQKSSWDGIRMTPPLNFDAAKIRYSLGFLFWKKGDWKSCSRTLEPFLKEAELRGAESRPEALLMLARSTSKLHDWKAAAAVLTDLIAKHPAFSGIDEAYIDIAASHARLQEWQSVDSYYKAFLEKHPDSVRRPYMDLYAALSSIGTNRATEGMAKLQALVRADTFEDLKADAGYHLAMQTRKSSGSDEKIVMRLLKESVDRYPRPRSLLEAGRCSFELGQWSDARTYLDRCLREFPSSDPDVQKQAEALLAAATKAELEKKRNK
ncbi:MAG: tetratricopeptide repeat protein [Lentisphaerae bacterium]|nr:tetratricopeptide repeat protein [Lentisphaerota bacterium]